MNEAQVRESVSKYLLGEISLQDLDRFLSSTTWDETALGAARALANDIQLRLDEYSSGACDESELNRSLRTFVTDYTVTMHIGPAPAVQVHTGLCSAVTTPLLIVKPTSVGTRLAAVPS